MADALYRLNRQSPARTRAAEGTRRDIVFGRLTLPWDEAHSLFCGPTRARLSRTGRGNEWAVSCTSSVPRVV
jgi:hypothetical protein